MLRCRLSFWERSKLSMQMSPNWMLSRICYFTSNCSISAKIRMWLFLVVTRPPLTFLKFLRRSTIQSSRLCAGMEQVAGTLIRPPIHALLPIWRSRCATLVVFFGLCSTISAFYSATCALIVCLGSQGGPLLAQPFADFWAPGQDLTCPDSNIKNTSSF